MRVRDFLKKMFRIKDVKLSGRGTPLIIKGGRHKGKLFFLNKPIDEMGGYSGAKTLDEFAEMGNMAAINSIFKDNYEADDEPFYYGHINNLGYIISHKDLYGEEP